jgi:hypothetical protein
LEKAPSCPRVTSRHERKDRLRIPSPPAQLKEPISPRPGALRVIWRPS